MKSVKRGMLFVVVITLFFLILAQAAIFSDDSQSDFDLGIYQDTTWNSDHVELSSNKILGNFTSQIFSGGFASWNNISWVQGGPYGIEMPNNNLIETEWMQGNLDMTDNRLLLHFNEDSGTVFYDSSGNNNHSSCSATCPIVGVNGIFGKALEFDGIDDSVSIPLNENLNPREAITIETWVYWNGEGGQTDNLQTVFLNGEWRRSMRITEPDHWNGGSQVNLQFRFGGTTKTLYSVSQIPIKSWTHIAITYNGSGLAIYINGEYDTSTSASGLIIDSNVDNFVGNEEGSYFFNGTIDELAIYNRSLAEQELLDHYKRGALKLNLSARSCDDSNCNGESWIDIDDSSPQILSTSNNQYFQYKAEFSSLNESTTPELYSVVIDYTTLDNEKPDISIISPLNQTYSNSDILVNISANDDNLDSVWWYNGSNNLTYASELIYTFQQGSNTIFAYANDTSGNVNWTQVTFYVDSNSPSISIISPLNQTYSNSDILVNISANDDNLDSVWWYNGSNNLTYASELIYTFQQGSNTIFAYANDTFGNLNQTSITFSVDFIPPLIEIVYPANFSYSRDITELNYTVDSTAESCWYSLNDGVNITMICGENLTSLMSSEGSNTWRIYSNDSTGNVNISSVTFLKDTISPTVVIEIPESLIYGYNDSLGLNYSIFEDNSIDACWYNLDNEDNITLTNCQNATFNVSDGSHILYLYSNDTLGNEGFDSVSFSVVTTAPALNIIAPKNNSYINLEEIYFNYSVTSGLALDTCELWGNFIGLWEKNQSDDSIEYGYNFFILNLSDGNYDGGVICNDSQNRISGVNSTFTVDTLNPLVTLTQPVGTKTSRTSIPIAFTLTELNTNTCWYNVYRGLTLEISNTTVNCSQTSSFDVTVDASFILNFYANDSAGNINYTHSSFTVSTVLADDDDDSGGGSGGGGGGGGIAPVVEDVKIKISARLISDLTMRAGEQKTMTVDITNEDNTFFNDCKLVADKLSWISSVATEDIAQGQEISFPFTLKIPNSADTGKKDLGLKLKCKEGEADISFVVDVIESSLVVEIKSIEEDSGIINVDYIIKENSGVDQEVNIRLWLTDTEGLTLTEGTDIASLKAGEEIEKEVIFEIPPESVGEFIINIEVTSGDTVNLVTDSIILGGGLGLAGRAIFGGGNSSIISIVLIVVLGVIFAFFIVKRIIKNSAKEDRSGYVKVKLGKNKRKH